MKNTEQQEDEIRKIEKRAAEIAEHATDFSEKIHDYLMVLISSLMLASADVESRHPLVMDIIAPPLAVSAYHLLLREASVDYDGHHSYLYKNLTDLFSSDNASSDDLVLVAAYRNFRRFTNLPKKIQASTYGLAISVLKDYINIEYK